MNRIKLHIDRLVLSGIEYRHAKKISKAITNELQRLFSDARINWVDVNSSSENSIDAGTFSILKETGPEGLGRQAAQTIYSSLSGK